MELKERSNWIKEHAVKHGFLLAGIAQVSRLNEEAAQLDEWLHRGYHGSMTYMANHKAQRLDPSILVPGAKSIICLAYNYYSPQKTTEESSKIAKYAHGRDYHKVVRNKMKSFWKDIQQNLGLVQGRYFVDSAPIMERQWAARAGLGWQGKNTLLINPKIGSYFFLAEIISDLELLADQPIADHCGTCTRCIDACPTEAIAEEGYLLKANQCISYFTIEAKEAVPEVYKSKMENWIFGCDICQDVCPWNRFSKEHQEPDFINKIDFRNWEIDKWINLSEEEFDHVFGHTPVKRAGYEKLKESIKMLTGI